MPFVEGCLYLILTLSLVMLIILLTDPRLHKELSTLSNEFFYNYRRGLESLNYIFSESINDPKILLKLGQIFFVRNKRNDVRSFFENITGLLDTLISCKYYYTFHTARHTCSHHYIGHHLTSNHKNFSSFSISKKLSR